MNTYWLVNGLAFSVGREMSSAKDPTTKEEDPPAPTPPAGDVESQTAEAGSGVAGIVRRLRREDLLKRGSLALRGLGLLFSLLAFIVMASNKHGRDWENFDKYEEYRVDRVQWCASGATGSRTFHRKTTSLLAAELGVVDFFGDQICTFERRRPSCDDLVRRQHLVAIAVVQGCELAVPDLPRHHRNGHRRRSMRPRRT
ncbi:hypothetical protein Acr_03g0006110 [Actinidia rufa]|uniref:CASP-like protein n=1 Tax=Actinidia rufa TaxID=165716 RepID=A0A7J0EBX6_9ERIC|nr:hypothetical protein Acr_03g0005960 [Actinidia rufa]GFY83837.1 hypothetical protein Acr_03g0006110 [Actinidia rufa]